ncbi:MAG TPA: HlyD family type I secretion periplasmic adaptor subunit [Zoogloea sp.]|uniref:HlyD family type I secretion periplasmic adaptor subunit n=1 Tax=Zoogloea sp. TaxID=49181 RepID=UPI002C15F6FE|nr:HlyD family type I secretion periplasmic adaptor subunit [Zoogloea sp.]HOB47522.1 HlyD family type I secretion periplasmic adaptor subunit [Zoogloea sp.]HQA12167.1 HlyD family type I secretion periplasmic adaptor subunit [Zoogloea sp.]
MKINIQQSSPRIEAQAISHHPDYERGPHLAVLILLGTTAAFFVLAFIWMSFARLDISVNAIGAVVPSSRLQQVQSMEGGILQALNAREGKVVKKGDVLATVQNLQFNAEQGETQQGQWGAQAALVRLDAEAHGVAPVFPAELEKNAPDIVREQRTLWQTRRQERENSLETLARQLAQRQQELAEARARHEASAEAIGPAREALAIEEKLAANGAGARADLLAAQQRYSGQKGEMETTRIAIGRIQAAVAEAQARLSETRARFLTETSKERSEAELRAAQLGEQLTGRNDKVARRDLRAPMDGVVNRVLVNTVGGVVKAGETIMEIVPAEDRLLITAKIKPADIAFLKPGQDARIRISAYDSSIFGTLPGKVLRVGADAVVDGEKKETFFEVLLEAQRNFLGDPSEHLTISPGMAADASIHTGKRTMMEYMLKPIVKTFDKSLRER